MMETRSNDGVNAIFQTYFEQGLITVGVGG